MHALHEYTKRFIVPALRLAMNQSTLHFTFMLRQMRGRNYGIYNRGLSVVDVDDSHPQFRTKSLDWFFIQDFIEKRLMQQSNNI